MSDAESLRIAEQNKYDSSVSQLERNIKGQFATPFSLAKAIVEDAIKRLENPKICLEPSCGTGAFISALKEVAPNLKIKAIEKDPRIFEIAHKLWTDDNTIIDNGDFFETLEDGASYDMLVANPPYSRHHHIPQKLKASYSNLVQEVTGKRISQLAGLHVYFILVGTSLVKEGGVASWLIPSELFSVNYGQVVKDFVTSTTSVERIHFFNNDCLQFADALVSSSVLVVRCKAAIDDDIVTITQGDFSHPSSTMEISIADLRKVQKWQHIFNIDSAESNAHIGDYFNVKRGLSTGAESFYAKSREEWHELGIGDEWLLPVLPAPRYMKSMEVDSDTNGWPLDNQRALLNIPIELDEDKLPDSVKNYLNSSPEKVRQSYTARHRKKWYAIERREPAPIVCTYMSRSDKQPFRFVRNRSSAVVTTAYLCLYPKRELSDSQLDMLCNMLNSISPSVLISSGREYGGGLRKLEPKELLSVPLLEPIG